MSSSVAAHLEVRELPLGGGVRREARVRIDGRADHIGWHYDILGETADVPVLDGYIHSVVFYLMRLGLPLRVHGDLTQAAIYNLDEFIRAWSQWRPKTYKYFEIHPDRLVTPSRPPMRRVISAFSGGMDANFTLVRNKTRAGIGGYDIKSVLMIHGFDVDYDNDAGFWQLVKRVQPTIESFGVDLKIIKTNSKFIDQNWEDSFGAQLAACLHQFSGTHDTALIGSSEPYTALVIPLGSSPLTDRLFSGGLMNVVHDGAQFPRTSKAGFLVNYPAVVSKLKVCWEGAVQHENCGICEKCVRTRLNFVAVGKPDPACFADPFDLSHISKLRARNAFQFSELRTLLAHAAEHGITDPWVDMLAQKLKGLRIRRWLINLIERIGLKEPIYRLLHLYDLLTQQETRAPILRTAIRQSLPDGMLPRAEVGALPDTGFGLAWPASQSSTADDMAAPTTGDRDHPMDHPMTT